MSDMNAPAIPSQAPKTAPRVTIKKLAFLASSRPEAQAALERLTARYRNHAVPVEDAQVIVALGGDGFMLETMHEYMSANKPIYGMNQGSLGFLMNDYNEDGLIERINNAEQARIHPLVMEATDADGVEHRHLAINEVHLLRQTRQAAKLAIFIDDKMRMAELICDGILVSTPAGSTAYNLSAHGPIIPIDGRVLAMTPISAFRPRRWRGALLPHTARVKFEVMEAEKRPISAVADTAEVRDVIEVCVSEDRNITLVMMFDAGRSLEDRVLAEQFSG